VLLEEALDLAVCATQRPESLRRPMQCTRSREAAEHGQRAHVVHGSRRRDRECSRQDRGEVRAPGPRGRPRRNSRHGALLEADRAFECRRETRHGVCTVAARASAIARRASPLEAGVLLRVLLDETRDLAAHDVNRDLNDMRKIGPRACDARCTARGRARPPSTVAEHTSRAVRDDVIANAPGRTEGRCEHLDLPIGPDAMVDRVIERRRDDRHAVRAVVTRATTIAHRISPLEAGVLLRVLLDETRELAAHDVNRELNDMPESLRAPRRGPRSRGERDTAAREPATPDAMHPVARGRRARSASTRRSRLATT
jgi:hypothetical protein